MCCKKHGQDNNTQKSPDDKNKSISSFEKKQSSFVDNKNKTNKKDDQENVIDDAISSAELSKNQSDDANEYSIDPELEAILARLVSDYRAIFAIEDELHHGHSARDGHTPCMSPHCQYCHSYQDGHR